MGKNNKRMRKNDEMFLSCLLEVEKSGYCVHEYQVNLVNHRKLSFKIEKLGFTTEKLCFSTGKLREKLLEIFLERKFKFFDKLSFSS